MERTPSLPELGRADSGGSSGVEFDVRTRRGSTPAAHGAYNFISGGVEMGDGTSRQGHGCC